MFGWIHAKMFYDRICVTINVNIIVAIQVVDVETADDEKNFNPISYPDIDSRCNGSSVGSVTVSHGNWFGFKFNSSTFSDIDECDDFWWRGSMWFDDILKSLCISKSSGCTWRGFVSKWIW